MKHKYFIPLLLFFMVCGQGPVQAQDQTSIPGDITLALKVGDASKLAEYLNSTVELLLLEKEDFYNKSVAENILKEFFDTHRTKEFVIRHQGARNDAQYAIGTLTTENGTFRVYFLMKKTENRQLIHQIRIESEDER